MACEYDGYMEPGLQSLTLVNDGFTIKQADNAANAYSLTSHQLGQGYINDTLLTYLWCELNDLNSGTIQRSGRLFVRTKGTLGDFVFNL